MDRFFIYLGSGNPNREHEVPCLTSASFPPDRVIGKGLAERENPVHAQPYLSVAQTGFEPASSGL